jgi:DNA-binding NtrC family response regulator
MCQIGEFREDLFYRLNVVTIHSPALRDRSTDIPELSRRFLHECCQEHSLGQKELSEFALKQLESYTWPGNVRELRNVIERTAIFSSDPVIDHIDDIDNASAVERPVTVHEKSLLDPNTDSVTLCLKSQSWERFQETAGREFLIFMLAKSNGNVSEAARSLDLERAYLHRLMKKLSINRN